jgi:hypothetical protein
MTIARIFSLGIVVVLVSTLGARGQDHKQFQLNLPLKSQGHDTGTATKSNATHIGTKPYIETLKPQTNVHFVPHIETPHVRVR